MAPAETIAEEVIQRLARLLGPNTARVAVQTFAKKQLGRDAETMVAPDLPLLLDGLKPMLRTLVGGAAAEQWLATTRREVGGSGGG